MSTANNDTPRGFTHERVETNNFLMIVLILVVVAIGGAVEIVPLFFQRSTTQPIEGVKPYSALQLAGRDVYLREGCYGCHSQMVRPLRSETLRYGQRVSVIALPAPPILLTAKGLEHVGPRAFGYDLDFRAVFAEAGEG